MLVALLLVLQVIPEVTYATSQGTITPGGLLTIPLTASGTVTVTVTGAGQTVRLALPIVAPVVTTPGRKMGPFGLWSSGTTVGWGPAPFTTSLQFTSASTVVAQIAAARTMHQTLILVLTGGAHADYLTNGTFDRAKWTARLTTFNTAAIKAAIAAGVADGTVLGNRLLDEPEHPTWNNSFTKPLIDSLARQVKVLFPTLPNGVGVGPPGYEWRASERYTVLDFVYYQYNWSKLKGDVVLWRTNALAQAAHDGVTPAFSVNVLDGGIPSTIAPCPVGVGTYGSNCRMTAAQLTTFGKALIAHGCYLTLWIYDGTFMNRSDNQTAFRALADSAAKVPARTCRRP